MRGFARLPLGRAAGIPLALALAFATALAQESAPASRAAETAPGEPSAGRAAAAEAAGRFKDATELFARAAREAPGDPEPRRGLLRCLASLGAINDALDRGEEALRAFPRDAELHALLARVLSLKADELARAGGPSAAQSQLYFEDAARTARKALELDGEHRDARLILAQSLLKLERFDEAEKEAAEAGRRFPSHPGGPLLAGEIAFERFLAAQRDLADELPERRSAAEAEKEKQFQAAATAFRKAIERDGKRARAWRLLGDLLAWKGKDDEVLECYREALALDPQGGAKHDFVQEHFKPEAAARLYAGAAELLAKNSPGAKEKAALLLWYQAYHLFRGKHFKECIGPFEEALRRNPTYLNSLFYLGRAADLEGDESAAQKYLTRYAREDPVSFADLLKGLGGDRDVVTSKLVFMAAKANREGAMQDCRELSRVLALARNTSDDWNNYALLCRDTGEFEKSYDAYLRALESSPDDPSLLNDCAVILQYHLHRDLDGARKMYGRALEEAQKVLKNPKADATERARARQAISDAKGNLQKL